MHHAKELFPDHLPLAPDFGDIPGEAPWLGIPGLLAWLRDPVELLLDRYQRFGPVSWTSLLHKHMLLLLGPDATELVLTNRGGVFSNFLGWAPQLTPYFAGGLMLRDGEEHLLHRRIMQVAFRQEALQRYLAAMNGEIDRLIDDWVPAGRRVVPMFPTLKSLTLDLAARIFLGEELGPEAAKLNEAFIDTVAASGPGAVIRTPIPGTLAWKGHRGRAFLEEYFRSAIPEKRATRTADFFSQLCHAVTPDGERLDDDEIVDHMIFLMMAAHDTTNITMNTMFFCLGRHRDWQQRCRQQVREVGGRHVGYDDLKQLTDLEMVMKESLRLVAPLPIMPRRATCEVEFAGYRIPAGAMVAVAPALVHHLDEVWPDPTRFDPERFAPGRGEDKVHRFAFVPFGGGAHKCIGLHFAELQVKAVLAQVLQRYEWQVDDDYVLTFDNTSLPRPSDDLPIALRRIDG